MVSKVIDVEDLNPKDYIELLIKYLDVCQSGRTKPNKNGAGYIRESVYNIDEIDSLKDKINNILRVNLKPKEHTVIFKDHSGGAPKPDYTKGAPKTTEGLKLNEQVNRYKRIYEL